MIWAWARARLPTVEIAVMATRHQHTLDSLLLQAETSDFFEEAASEFLEDKGVPLFSHSRQAIISLAWRHGWRPSL
jgi:hypothetical protein